MKRIIILAAVLAMWAQSAHAQQWQPATWPPPAPLPVCADGWSNDCDEIARGVTGLRAAGYQLANQRALGYGTDIALDIDGAFDYAQQQAQQWNAQTGRYDNESWMWQPAPQAQQQWLQQRGRWQR